MAFRDTPANRAMVFPLASSERGRMVFFHLTCAGFKIGDGENTVILLKSHNLYTVRILGATGSTRVAGQGV